MRTLILISNFLVLGLWSNQSLYDIQLKDIDGNEISMNVFAGKKIMIVVLPASQHAADSVFLHSIDSIHEVYADLNIIATPAFEDGYNIENSAALKLFYKGMLGTGITITKGMYTRKGAAQNQHALFAWLTHDKKNNHFNQDVEGPGQKFFVNASGELYAVIGPGMPLSSRHIPGLIQQ